MTAPLSLWAGGGLLLLLILATLAGPMMLPDPEAMDLAVRLGSPSTDHLLGTDELGRDIAARLVQGGQVSLVVAALTATLAALFGTVIGLLSGYYGGPLDSALMRLTDGVMALPLLPLLIILAAADPAQLGMPPDIATSEPVAVARLAVIIACVSWTGVARLVRGSTLSTRARDHVRAAEALGAGPVRVMVRHILPDVASPVVVAATLSVGHVILIESALSFLGLGLRPPLASWGNMLTGAMDVVWTAPAMAIWPGAAIFATVLAFNLLGEGLQQRLSPDLCRR
ncbi:ABC transporter permease protein; putative dipeptide transport protein [Magnetospirillum molischianum DSM 120]|uniref:ABC transporter permease protein putative dipeptide transport protein n=1 Tax=Magnetospirillum molischianum DSM 120 TaxID=1150626 RepID=H8FWZ1_MAGML|nr:ABC transporter permease protein; putative dipeptide transport protein [Magnetospirillum molischianum DSM 120]